MQHSARFLQQQKNVSIRLTRYYLLERQERRVPWVSDSTSPCIIRAVRLELDLSALPLGRGGSTEAEAVRDVRSSRSGLLRLRRRAASRLSPAMSISPVGGFFVPPSESFCFSRRAPGKSRESEKVWRGARCIGGAASHFRLDHGWQVKENKNCLHRRENSSFLISG